jgi:hypothetical protein
MGSNYPVNSLATIYVDGDPLGTVMTDGNGSATFYINTIGSDIAIYNITLEVDINASATDSFELDADGPLIPPPPDPSGPLFFLNQVTYLPSIVKN